MSLLEPTDLDREIYAAQLAPFLPARVIDIHTHSWLNAERALRVRNRVATWPSLVASTHPIEDLLETYRLLLPGKEVVPMIFARVMDRSGDITGGNAYVAEHGRPDCGVGPPDRALRPTGPRPRAVLRARPLPATEPAAAPAASCLAP